MRKAIESDPTLAPEYRANEEKDKGNKAFSEKRYSAAVAHFSLSIELEPTNEVRAQEKLIRHVYAYLCVDVSIASSWNASSSNTALQITHYIDP